LSGVVISCSQFTVLSSFNNLSSCQIIFPKTKSRRCTTGLPSIYLPTQGNGFMHMKIEFLNFVGLHKVHSGFIEVLHETISAKSQRVILLSELAASTIFSSNPDSEKR